MKLRVVILAAGRGQRMHSLMPKVLHTIGGRSMLDHILTAIAELDLKLPPIIVSGHQATTLQQAFPDHNIVWVNQKQQLGTGHALKQALAVIAKDEIVLVLSGDVPLITATTLLKLATTTTGIGMITARIPDASGYGRIIRNEQQQVVAIVEEKDAANLERDIQEINTGIYCVAAAYLHRWLPQLKRHNTQREYYLTDIINYAVTENIAINTIRPQYPEEVLGVNSRFQLHKLERFYQQQQVTKFMTQGVTFYDATRVDVRGDVKIGQDVIIDVNVILEGKVVIADGCIIGPNVLLRNTSLGHGVVIKANTVLDGADVAAAAVIGPFARIRPHTKLSKHVQVGNFVEIKNSEIAEQSKINHLSYIGDSDVGMEVNIGAGTITCNYDGSNKHRTTIGDGAFIGSGSELVAPVIIGANATIAAGSTITKNAPAQQLTIARARQKTSSRWQRPAKKQQSIKG